MANRLKQIQGGTVTPDLQRVQKNVQTALDDLEATLSTKIAAVTAAATPSTVAPSTTVPGTGSGGTVVFKGISGVTASLPLLSSGGSTPNISFIATTPGQVLWNLSGVLGFQYLTIAGVNGLTAALAALVPSTRLINTTAPMTGGGSLASDLTLAVPSFVGSGAGHASGLVPDPGSSAGTTKFLREDATFAVPAYPASARCGLLAYADLTLAAATFPQWLIVGNQVSSTTYDSAAVPPGFAVTKGLVTINVTADSLATSESITFQVQRNGGTSGVTGGAVAFTHGNSPGVYSASFTATGGVGDVWGVQALGSGSSGTIGFVGSLFISE